MHRLLFTIIVLALLPLAPDALGQERARMQRTREQDIQFHRARTAWTTGNSLLEARARLDRVLEQLPNDIPALKLRSAVLLEMSVHEAAMADAIRATDLAPSDGEAQLLLCESALASGEDQIATEAMQAAANLLLQDVERYVRLSRCAWGLGRTTESLAIARIALGTDRTDPRGHVQLARVFVLSGDEESARSVLRSVLDMQILRRETILADTLLAPLLLDL